MVYSAFDSYHNIWLNLDTYEREARLHIELVRIQPFEDGNKRAARILTNFNLCYQNKAPVIITGSETDEYFGYIDDYDVEGMRKFLDKKSHEELNIMMDLYQSTVEPSAENGAMSSVMETDEKSARVAEQLFDDIATTIDKVYNKVIKN